MKHDAEWSLQVLVNYFPPHDMNDEHTLPSRVEVRSNFFSFGFSFDHFDLLKAVWNENKKNNNSYKYIILQ